MLRFLLAFFVVMTSALPAYAQGASSLQPLPRGPRISALSEMTRGSQALQNTPHMVARLLIRFDGGDVTTSLIKSNPHGFRVNAVSGGIKWKGIARSVKPKRLEAGTGPALVSSDWNVSNESRRARCQKDNLGDGFYQVVFLRRTDTSDTERDSYICAFEHLTLPSEDLSTWLESIEEDKIPVFNSCADSSENKIDENFWSCLRQSDIEMPQLTLEMAKRIKG